METIYFTPYEALTMITRYLSKHSAVILNKYSNEDYSIKFSFPLIDGYRVCIDVNADFNFKYTINNKDYFVSHAIRLDTIYLDEVDAPEGKYEFVIREDR